MLTNTSRASKQQLKCSNKSHKFRKSKIKEWTKLTKSLALNSTHLTKVSIILLKYLSNLIKGSWIRSRKCVLIITIEDKDILEGVNHFNIIGIV